MKRLLIVSNRLPVTVSKRAGKFEFKRSVGGVATGLSAYHKNSDSLWIGWPEIPSARLQQEERDRITQTLESEQGCVPVFLTQADVKDFYFGFSNRTLWPLFHHFNESVEYDKRTWAAYERVNRKFCDAVLEVARPDDTIWVQDYQLMLLPQMLREHLPDASIGFFLHIPFPCYEVFRALPWRREILEGLLGADLVGFHTYDYVRYFLGSVNNICGIDDQFGRLNLNDRRVLVDAFPMGIDFDNYADGAESVPAVREANKLRKRTHGRKIVLSVDRLDYTKGIPGRLRAFDRLLEQHPEWRGNVNLVCVAVPSRTKVEEYRLLKEEVDRLVGSINGRWSSMDWVPVRYLYRGLPFPQLVGMYAAADVCCVTPLRDGMNLIAKEYCAACTEDDGVLMLSEMAGAARELREAVLVNPNDSEAMVEALHVSLSMPQEERIPRMRSMRDRVRRYTIQRWVQDFLDRLAEIRLQQSQGARRLDAHARAGLIQAFKASNKRVLLLDYDGTLMPFAAHPAAVTPDPIVVKLVQRLSTQPGTELVIISGRERETLDRWLGHIPVSMIAEHGAWLRSDTGEWVTIEPMDAEWKKRLSPVMEMFVDRTPGSFLEEKEYSLVWHFREVAPGLAQTRVAELHEALSGMLRDHQLGAMDGNRTVEVKRAEVNKGRAAHRWMSGEDVGFVLAIGDDRTDEDTFEAAPDDAWTIKVGAGPTAARYSMDSVVAVRELLAELAGDMRM
jgi:trehalose 6-phosphate synthase/phosphatase